MNEKQEQVWDILCSMSGEDVARLWTNIYGNQVLDDKDVVDELILEGYEELEDFEEEDEE